MIQKTPFFPMNQRCSLPRFATVLALMAAGHCTLSQAASSTTAQYEHEEILIPSAHASEAKRSQFSIEKALAYLDEGALAWSKDRQCVSCHTNGSYLLTRPSLTDLVGPPTREVREFFQSQLLEFQTQSSEALRKGIVPTQVAYLAAGLAQWDRHVDKQLSSATTEAIELMLGAQSENGAFSNDDCWPPLESSEYHGATVAALAILAAPTWFESASAHAHKAQVEKLWQYLRKTPPPHDYARLLLLWVGTEKPDLLDHHQQDDLKNRLLELQLPDGGWSMRSFARPHQWGDGTRESKLQAEGNYDHPESDGHQTGLTAYVLLRSGIGKNHPAIQKATHWLLTNQRESGRWWTRSLNTDKYHFITYSGTCYPLLALAEAGAIPKRNSGANAAE